MDQAIYDKKDERDIDERNQNKAGPTEYVEIAYNCAQRLEIIDRIENDDLVKRVENGIDKVPDILQRVPQKIHVVFRKFSHTSRRLPTGGRMPPDVVNPDPCYPVPKFRRPFRQIVYLPREVPLRVLAAVVLFSFRR